LETLCVCDCGRPALAAVCRLLIAASQRGGSRQIKNFWRVADILFQQMPEAPDKDARNVSFDGKS
jgi:hypothetical protein